MNQGRRLDRRAFLRAGGAAAALAAAGAALPNVLRRFDHDPPEVVAGAAAQAADPADLDPVALTLAMVRFDTSHAGEGGVTRPHAEWMKARWEGAGIPTEIIPTPKPDNVHFIARIPAAAAAAPPLLLLCHSDVVSVDRDRWSIDPFAGVVQDGFIYGRGALDMKGANAAFMAALLRHVGEGARFDRDIIFVSDADEEAGPYGGRWLAANHWDRVAAGAVLTEGGWLLTGRDGATPLLAAVTVADRTSATVDLATEAVTTHSSRPMPDAAIVRLNRAVARLSEYEPDVFLCPASRTYFAALADAVEGDDPRLARALRLLLSARSQGRRNRAGALVVKRSPYPWLHNAQMRPTLAYVIEQGGYRVNIIPGTATAQVNMRLVPGGPPFDQLLEEMRAAVADPEVTLSLRPRAGLTVEETAAAIERARTTPAASTDTDVFAAWSAAAAETYPGAGRAPCLFEAGTSGGPWRQKGIPVYGLYPYAIDNETITRMHGDDERVGVEALRAGTELMYRLFARFRL